MLVNGAPECIQINQMIWLPFVPRTRTNYQATPDVLKATFYFYSYNTQYLQNKTTIHLASTTTYKIYNIHKLHQSAPPQASGRQDPRGCPLRGWPRARHRGAARASLREWNIPLPYMGPSTVSNAVTRARQSLRCCFRFSFVSLRPFWIEVPVVCRPAPWASWQLQSMVVAGRQPQAACGQLPVCRCCLYNETRSCWLSHYMCAFVQIASNYSVIPLVLFCSFLSKVVLVSPAPCVSVPHVCSLRNCLTSSVITFRFFFGIGMVTGKVWSISVVCIRWFGNLT